MSDQLHIFGVRHHGPGSARALRRALDELNPDCVLLEGPPDADEIIPFVTKPEMEPPVAILVHDVEKPQDAVYYPFAEFSPEWQALKWSLKHDVPVRFMDLPQFHRMPLAEARMKAAVEAMEKSAGAAPPESEVDVEDAAPPSPPAEPDPIAQLARAAGYDDGERWWEHVVEHQRGGSISTFAAINDAMAELRKADTRPRDADEPYREAWMRRTIRSALAEKFSRIAVVCGAWHAPALDVDSFTKKDDDELLRGLPKVKTAATWIPWTYDRLSMYSGYGAGVRSPGWYDHLWRHDQHVLETWMSRVARLLRERDIDCSSAHVIEAVRLSETLATFRGRALADLADIADATRSVFFADSDLPMRLIDRELLVGVRLGSVPEDTPLVPLLADLQRAQKRLRLKPEAGEKPLDLDLRNETDRDRSRLLHRLRLLGVNWGIPHDDRGKTGKGTFHELWQLKWDPAFSVKLIEAGTLGPTIEDAAANQLKKLAVESTDLRRLSSLLHDAMLADVGSAVSALVQQLENVSAVAADVTLLMAALPQLASVLRYGNVRQSDESMVRHIVNGIVPRITVGLGGAVASLNDEAAAAMEEMIRSTHAAVELLESQDHTTAWLDALLRIVDQDSVHGLVRGRSARLLLDAARLTTDDVARRLSLALSRGSDSAQSARWIEGFLTGSGLLLIHDPKLLAVIDAWVGGIQPEIFDELLPLLRRTFSTFPAPERRQIGQMIASGPTRVAATKADGDASIDPTRGAAALPLILQLLGAKR